MKKYKITLFGVKETTKIIAKYLFSQGIQVDLIVSIDKSVAEKNNIANYMDLESTAKSIGADYYCVKDYSLKQNTSSSSCAGSSIIHTMDPADKPRDVDRNDHFFHNNTFELGIVYGWQRLIPEPIISRFEKGLFGFHASPDILPKGRGRSPLNWGIILGKKTLYNHLFKYVSGADAGDIYSITKFEITPHDTILTLLYKSLVIAKTELIKLIHDVNSDHLKLIPQTGEGSFFKKRSPEDGLIFFEKDSTKTIVNLIRGVTSPFPGAFCFKENGLKITIFEAWEFDQLIDFSQYKPGDVIDNIYNLPLIKTVDSSIILKHYEGGQLMPNDRLVSKC